MQAAQRRQHQRVGIGELLRLDGELHLVDEQRVRNPVLAMQGLGVQCPQPLQRVALTPALAFERGERQVRQKMVVARNAANGRLDGIAPQRRVQVFVEEGFELRFGSGVLSLSVHVGDSQHDENGEQDSTTSGHVW